MGRRNKIKVITSIQRHTPDDSRFNLPPSITANAPLRSRVLEKKQKKKRTASEISSSDENAHLPRKLRFLLASRQSSDGENAGNVSGEAQESIPSRAIASEIKKMKPHEGESLDKFQRRIEQLARDKIREIGLGMRRRSSREQRKSYLNARKERLKTQREKKVKQAERREVRQVDLALEADLARMQRQERAEGIDSPHVSGSDRFRPRRGTQHPSEPDVELHSSDDEIQLLYPQGSVKPTESSSRSEDASMSKSKRRRERRSRTVKIQESDLHDSERSSPRQSSSVSLSVPFGVQAECPPNLKKFESGFTLLKEKLERKRKPPTGVRGSQSPADRERDLVLRQHQELRRAAAVDQYRKFRQSQRQSTRSSLSL